MRLRGRKGILEEIERQKDLIVLTPTDYKGKWAEFFGNGKPIHVELGMGKGKFISEMSVRHPEVNYIGVDMYDELVRRASEKARIAANLEDGAAPPNLALARMNIERIEEAFAPGEIERIYLNFSDPWPKKKHARRRLTHAGFLHKYRELLNAAGEIHFKTDSRSLFEFSLNTFADLGLRMRNISLDLHVEGCPEWNVTTEYESKFSGRGMPIHRVEVVLGEAALHRHLEQLSADESTNASPKT
ncbi:tRNA (guanosine(46)-N7)-methyltransferase TrmB [Paenibacillus koleovorans]|uniref:tRNA (guanosine(46)-N7)-methyltransferase TrmB n=1 Tax=Paenibacillus koleovorans TaxID=121608 RepID=UPI000FD7F73D|nr:tRNA (guanosine(46)-N7)-methyltransferase TrmB [Paenibacillus koleovorans]